MSMSSTKIAPEHLDFFEKKIRPALANIATNATPKKAIKSAEDSSLIPGKTLAREAIPVQP